MINRLRVARDAGATVFVAGNGGSAATASHWVNDLCKATRCANRPLIRATCLSDNTSWLTALANDEGYERVFAAQLESLGRRGDVLALISASGNSPNLIAAVDAAKELGIDTVGMLGFDGGRLARYGDPAPLAAHAGRRVRARRGRPRGALPRDHRGAEVRPSGRPTVGMTPPHRFESRRCGRVRRRPSSWRADAARGLRPLTDTRPKPMVEFHGRPFLEYMVEQLRDQGLRRILLLLGYLPRRDPGALRRRQPLRSGDRIRRHGARRPDRQPHGARGRAARRRVPAPVLRQLPAAATSTGCGATTSASARPRWSRSTATATATRATTCGSRAT